MNCIRLSTHVPVAVLLVLASVGGLPAQGGVGTASPSAAETFAGDQITPAGPVLQPRFAAGTGAAPTLGPAWASALLPTSDPVTGGTDVWVAPLDEPSTAVLVVGGALGWAVGLAGGAALGYAWRPDDVGESMFGPAEMWLGAWLGSSLGAAAGANLANRGQGSLGLSWLVATASVPAVLLLGVPLVEIGVLGALVVPAVQVGTSVAIERLTGRAHPR